MDDLAPLVDSDELSPEAALKLHTSLKPGSACMHRSWGYGRITAWDVAEGKIVVDFLTKSSHSMAFQFAAESLTPVSAEHIAARILTEPESVKAQASADPAGLMRNVIESLGTGASPLGIEQALVPHVIPAADWRKFWENARKAMRKDGCFVIPAAKTAPLQVLAEAPKPSAQLETKGLIPTLKGAQDLADHPDQIAGRSDEVRAFLVRVEEALRTAPGTQKLNTLKLHLLRDHLAAQVHHTPAEDVTLTKFILDNESALPSLVNDLTAADQRRVMEGIRAAEPHTWAAAIAGFLRTGSARLLGTIRDFFAASGEVTLFGDALRRAVRDQTLSSEGLIWLLRNRKGEFAHLVEPRLFSSVLAAIERDQLGERRSHKLRDLVVTDRTLLGDLISTADTDAVRDVTRALLLTTVFDEMDKRSLLSRIIALYPEAQELVTQGAQRGRGPSEAGPKSESEGPLIVSWTSLERRKAELDELVTKKLPQNTQDIALARSYGDLRENAEFKFAKEQQRVLNRQRAELEAALTRAQATDFSDADTSKVSIGTIVTVTDGANEVTYTILGAWDSDPARNVISYLTPIARALLNKAPGDPAAFTDEHGRTREVTVKSITPYNAA